MYRSIILIALLCAFFVSINAAAHDMTPTYPKWKITQHDGIYKTTMEMFNSRTDVNWYEIGVFDDDWKPIRFVTSYRVFKLEYLGVAKIDVYINAIDKDRAEYICSKSKLKGGSNDKPMVESRICSRFK